MNTNIGQFVADVGTGDFYIKSFLVSNLGTEQVEIDQIDVDYTVPAIVCTSWTYTAWGACDGGVQTRTIVTSSPLGCAGGVPTLSQACTPALWPFTTAGNYTYDITKIDVTGGVATLLTKDQVDDDNDATGGFGAGVHSSTQWDGVNSWVELTAGGIAGGTGDFTSRILDAGGSVAWTTINWARSDTPTFTYNRVYPAAPNGPYRVHAMDIDGDGDIDFATASYIDDTLAWYENDGAGGFTQRILTAALNGARGHDIVDLDGDGDYDIIGASQIDGIVNWYENDGAEVFTEKLVANTPQQPFDLHAIDVDGDTDIDIVVAEYIGDVITWYENDGAENFTERTIAATANGANYVYAMDVDGDGDIDFMSSSRNDDLFAWYENDGVQNFTQRVIDNSANEARFIYGSDIDQDGDVDIIGGYNFAAPNFAWYENDGAEVFTQRLITSTMNSVASAYPVDFDNDGDIDLIALGKSSTDLMLMQNDGSENFTEISLGGGLNSGNDGVPVDIDGDGDLDVLVANYTGDDIIWYNAVPNIEVKLQARSCDDAICAGENFIGPDGTAGTYYTTTGEALNAVNNQYFQYKAYLISNDNINTPELQSVTIDPAHFDAGNPTIINATGQAYDTLISFTEVLGGGNVGTVNYQISNDGVSWYYWNGSNWIVETGSGYPTQTTAQATVNTNFAQFGTDVGNGDFYFKAFLASNLGIEQVEIDEIDIDYTSPVAACTSFNYTAWAGCDGTTETRTVISSVPAVCTGGVAQVLSQACTLPAPAPAPGGGGSTPVWILQEEADRAKEAAEAAAAEPIVVDEVAVTEDVILVADVVAGVPEAKEENAVVVAEVIPTVVSEVAEVVQPEIPKEPVAVKKEEKPTQTEKYPVVKMESIIKTPEIIASSVQKEIKQELARIVTKTIKEDVSDKIKLAGFVEPKETIEDILVKVSTPEIIKPHLVSGAVSVRAGGKVISKYVNALDVEKDIIKTTTGNSVQFMVRMDEPIRSIKGLVVFKSRKPVEFSQKSSFKSFLTSFFTIEPTSAKLADEDVEGGFEVSEFDYNDLHNDGTYSAKVLAPIVVGEYDLVTKVNFEDTTIPEKEIRFAVSVNQQGFVYFTDDDKEIPVTPATVSLFWMNPTTNQYELWSGEERLQSNPQVTDYKGIYSFFPPAGSYYLEVESPYYKKYRSKNFTINEGDGVYEKVELKRSYWWFRVLMMQMLIGVALSVVLFHQFRKVTHRVMRSRSKK